MLTRPKRREREDVEFGWWTLDASVGVSAHRRRCLILSLRLLNIVVVRDDLVYIVMRTGLLHGPGGTCAVLGMSVSPLGRASAPGLPGLRPSFPVKGYSLV